MLAPVRIIWLIGGISIISTRLVAIPKNRNLASSHHKIMKRAKRQKNQAEYRASDTVKTVRGEGVIKFVFPRTRNGKIAYSVNFADKRLGIIFHENELALSARESRHG